MSGNDWDEEVRWKVHGLGVVVDSRHNQYLNARLERPSPVIPCVCWAMMFNVLSPRHCM